MAANAACAAHPKQHAAPRRDAPRISLMAEDLSGVCAATRRMRCKASPTAAAHRIAQLAAPLAVLAACACHLADAQQRPPPPPGDWGRAGGKGWSCTARAIEAECRAAADADWLRSNPPSGSGGGGGGAADGEDPQAELLLTLICR